MIDLRSDTVTLPSPAMREAIAKAELGDDVMGEDPTVNRLQELAAEKVGKDSTKLNCVLTLSQRGFGWRRSWWEDIKSELKKRRISLIIGLPIQKSLGDHCQG